MGTWLVTSCTYSPVLFFATSAFFFSASTLSKKLFPHAPLACLLGLVTLKGLALPWLDWEPKLSARDGLLFFGTWTSRKLFCSSLSSYCSWFVLMPARVEGNNKHGYCFQQIFAEKLCVTIVLFLLELVVFNSANGWRPAVIWLGSDRNWVQENNLFYIKIDNAAILNAGLVCLA